MHLNPKIANELLADNRCETDDRYFDEYVRNMNTAVRLQQDATYDNNKIDF